MPDAAKIMIADGDENSRRLLNLYLAKEGFAIQLLETLENLPNLLRQSEPDMVLLEDPDAVASVRGISEVPIIVVSGRSDPIDRIAALDAGADDYVSKPYEAQELISRIRAVLRRSRPAEKAEREIRVEDLCVNLSDYTVSVGGAKLAMPPKEVELLYFLAARPNRICTREQILESVWAKPMGDSRTVDVHIKRIRTKLGVSKHWKITTVWSVGYKFEC